MSDKSEVFCLTAKDGRPLSPSVQSTILAKYSRTPESARTIVEKLTEEEADKFQDKWVVGYGHNSVAELSSVAICLENVSIVASKVIEGWQRAGYSEKSTRYQEFSRDSFVTPPGAPSTMKEFAGRYYDTYEELMQPMIEICKGHLPGQSARVVKALAFDQLRYLLPAGTGTSVGMNCFVRDARDMIVTLRGSTNPELRMLGDKVHSAVYEVAPTLVKHTEANSFELPVTSLGPLHKKFDLDNPDWYVELYKPHMNSQPMLVERTFESNIADRYGMSWSAFCEHMNRRGEHTPVPNIFKTVQLSFEIMMDYGAFRDLQRHRRCEQYVEPLTSNYGYIVPDLIVGTHIESKYRETMESIQKYDDDLVVNDADLMQYMVPLGYLHRSIFQMDLKELYYLCELRTKLQGHISYRRVAYAMYEKAREIYPQLMEWCRVVSPTHIGSHT